MSIRNFLRPLFWANAGSLFALASAPVFNSGTGAGGAGGGGGGAGGGAFGEDIHIIISPVLSLFGL
jgi:hypothetical protein